jgi:hypothetical protein
MKAFFLATLLLLFKNGAALIFANFLRIFASFFKHSAAAAEFVEIVCTRADHSPCQPTIAAQLLLDGGKIDPYTIRIMHTTTVVEIRG